MKAALLGRRSIFGFWAMVTLLAVASGCQQSTPPGADMVAAKVGQASYTFLHWKKGLRVMIWFDMAAQVSGEGSGSTEDPVHRVMGHAAASDGRRVDWRLETENGTTATFNIDDQSYDLSEGTLFLVRTQGGDVRVQQLSRDLSGLQPTNESCAAFAATDPDVSSFIRSADGAQ